MSRRDPSHPEVLVVGADDVRLSPGGLGRYAEALGDALGDAEVIVLGPGDPRGAAVGVCAPDEALHRRLRAVAAAVASRDPVVLDVHFPLYGLVPVLRRRGRPLVAHHHGPWAEEARSAGRGGRAGVVLRDLLEGAVLRRADEVVVLSRAFRDAVTRRHGLFPARVRVIPPGVTCRGADRGAARATLGLSDDDHLVVTVRRLVPRTGVDVLVGAWPAVLTGTAALAGRRRLVVVGDGPERPRLEELAADVGADVTFTGTVDDGELDDLYAAADVCVVPSVALEGFGLVILEAACHGTPSVATDVGGLRDAVEPLGADLVVPAGDRAALAARLVDAMTGRRPLPDRERVRAHAHRAGWDAVAEEHRRVYRAARNRPRPRVVFVIHTARPSGAELALTRLLEARPDLDAHVISLEEGPILGRLAAAGASVETLDMAPEVTGVSRTELSATATATLAARGAAGFGALVRRLRRLRPDAVVATALKSTMLCGAARPLVGAPFVPFLVDDLDSGGYPPAAVAMARRMARDATATISNSSATRTSWRLPATESHVVIHPGHARRAPTVPAPEDPFTVAMVGRIAPWKGQDVALEAFARAFPPDGPPARLVIAGDAMFGEEDAVDRLRSRAGRDDLAGRVELVGHVDDVEAVLDAATVVVHASVRPEPFGQVVVEAMAAARPVVASAAGGVTEIVTDGTDGLLTPPGDVAALAAALGRLHDDPALRRRLAGAAVDRARELSVAVTARSTAELIRSVTSAGRT